MQKQKFYLTTTLPYVNAAPHIGFALEIIEADVIARYQSELLHREVIFNTGTDEHGQKIWQKAQEAQLDPQAYCDLWADKFLALKDLLNLSFNQFTRTTDPQHITAAQEFWRRCAQQGDIYKAKYQVKYCVGCELAKTDSELDHGRCPLHPQQALEIREEENYFFRFSKYAPALLKLYKAHPDFVQPASRLKEIESFVNNGLTDFSISRLKDKMPWGIVVPDDEKHVMYVWFDALVNYISALGWPQNQEKFMQFWPGIQLAGKDNLRQQAAMWQAMLLSAQLANSKQILINGFISVDGQKMSKSLGNVISPDEMVKRYGVDGTRYLLLQLGSFGEDHDVTFAKLDTTFNAYLANGLGNLCSRVAKMAEGSSFQHPNQITDLTAEYINLMDHFKLSETLNYIDQQITAVDKFLAQKTPWTKAEEQKSFVLQVAIQKLLQISQMLSPFLPQAGLAIKEHFTDQVKTFSSSLFPRIK